MNALDRIAHDLAAIDAVNLEEDMHGDETIADHAVCLVRELRPLLLLLREWEAAHEAYEVACRHPRIGHIPQVQIIKAQNALLAALRSNPGDPGRTAGGGGAGE